MRRRRLRQSGAAAALVVAVLVLCRSPHSSLEAAPGKPPLAVTLTAVGDILLDRGPGRQIERFGTAYPFAHVRQVLSTADITFGGGTKADLCTFMTMRTPDRH